MFRFLFYLLFLCFGVQLKLYFTLFDFNEENGLEAGGNRYLYLLLTKNILFVSKLRNLWVCVCLATKTFANNRP